MSEMEFINTILHFYKLAQAANFSYLAIGYLKCGIFVQLTKNEPFPFRYLFSYTKCNDLTNQVVTSL